MLVFQFRLIRKECVSMGKCTFFVFFVFTYPAGSLPAVISAPISGSCSIDIDINDRIRKRMITNYNIKLCTLFIVNFNQYLLISRDIRITGRDERFIKCIFINY